MRSVPILLLSLLLIATPASALETIGAYVDVGGGNVRYADTPIGTPFDIVVIQKSELPAGATEFSVTELQQLYPGVFKINVLRANNSGLDLGNNDIGEYVIAFGDRLDAPIELVRVTYLDVGGLIEDNVVLNVGGNIEILTGCTGVQSPCYAGYTGPAITDVELRSLYAEPPSLVTGDGVPVPEGAAILNPTYPVMPDDPAMYFAAEARPQTLNLKSQGQKFGVRLTQSADVGVEAIAPNTLLFNGMVPAIPGAYHIDYAMDPPTMTVFFPRDEVGDTLSEGDEVAFTVSGALFDGAEFVANGALRVIEPGNDPGTVAFGAAANPNPFNPSTNIEFALPEGGYTRITIYDAAGRLVKTLVSEFVGPGAHSAPWDGRDTSGRAVASGVYFYRVQSGDLVATDRMVLVK